MDLLIPSVSAIIAAILGVFLSTWFLRSKLWVSISSVERDDTILVNIPEKTMELVQRCYYNVGITKMQIPLHELISAHKQTAGLIGSIEDSIKILNSFNRNLISTDDKEKYTSSLLSNYLIRMRIGNELLAGSLPLPNILELDNEKENTPVILSDDFTDPENENKGIVFYIKNGSYSINFGNNFIGNIVKGRIKTLNKIIQYFMNPYLNDIIEFIRKELQNDLDLIDEIQQNISNLIHSRKLKVNVKISNIGGKPANIDPYGILKIRSIGEPVKPIIVIIQDYHVYEPGSTEFPKMMEVIEGLAKNQGISTTRTPSTMKSIPEYIVVKPGDLIDVELVTMNPIDDDSIIASLEAGYLPCQIILKRVDRKYLTYFKSKEQTMGYKVSDKKMKELEKMSKK